MCIASPVSETGGRLCHKGHHRTRKKRLCPNWGPTLLPFTALLRAPFWLGQHTTGIAAFQGYNVGTGALSGASWPVKSPAFFYISFGFDDEDKVWVSPRQLTEQALTKLWDLAKWNNFYGGLSLQGSMHSYSAPFLFLFPLYNGRRLLLLFHF